MALPASSVRYPWITSPEAIEATDLVDDEVRSRLLARAIPLLTGRGTEPSDGGGNALLAFVVGFAPALLLLRR